MRLIDADKFIRDETKAYEAVQADLAGGDGMDEAKRLINEIVHRKIVQLVEDADTVNENGDRPKGKWFGGKYSVLCSECGNWSEKRTHYCAKCGAEMVNVDEYKELTR